jgi:hypothetical protein
MEALRRETKLKHSNNPTGELVKNIRKLYQYNQIQKQRKRL